MRKANNYKNFIENEDIQNVKKTIGESTISERSAVVVGRAGFATRAAPQPEAKNKTNVIPMRTGATCAGRMS